MTSPGLHVALLRGINVGGHRKILMADLRELMSGLGYTDVRTYVQSGNIVFGAEPGHHGSLIHDAIAERFGHDVPTVVLSAAAFVAVKAADPFRDRNDVDPSRRGVMFLHERPAASSLPGDIPAGTGEAAVLVDGHVYLCCPQGFAETKLHTAWFERTLGVAATARNIKTVWALSDMLC